MTPVVDPISPLDQDLHLIEDPEARYKVRIERVDGDLWRVVEEGWANQKNGIAVAELLGQMLDDLARRDPLARLWLCADYTAYEGTEAIARERMMRRVVRHPALGGVAFHGGSLASFAMARLIEAIMPRLRVHACGTESESLAWIRAQIEADRRCQDPAGPRSSWLQRQRKNLDRLLPNKNAELESFRRSRDLLFDYLTVLSRDRSWLQREIPPPPQVSPDDPLFVNFSAIQTFQRDMHAMLAERDQRLAELGRARAQAEEAGRVRKEFLGVVSHELRTPLAAIAGFSSLLMETPLDGDQRHAMEAIVQASRRLTRLVDDLLDFTRMETGALRLKPAPFLLDEVLRELELLFTQRAAEAGIALIMDTSSILPERVIGDRDRLLQVLGNLVENALKFTTQGEVRVALRPAGRERFLFSVQDTGRGIEEEDLERVFRRFERGVSRHGEVLPGIGLGLSICQELVEIMGGQLRVESKVGEGTRFEFEIPLVTAELLTLRRPGPQPSVSQPSVLVVEDDPACAAVAQRLLESQGCSATIAVNGQQAVELATSGPFDLVLMDLHLPLVDGFEATRQIRSRLQAREEVGGDSPSRAPAELRAHLPIVATTAFDVDERGEEARQAGFDAFYSKPLTSRRLVDLLAAHLPGFSPTRAGVDRTGRSRSETAEPRSELFQVLGTGRAVTLVERELPELLRQTRGALATRNLGSLVRYVHRLRGLALLLGDEQVAERAGRQGASLEAAGITPEGEHATQDLIAAAEALLGEIRSSIPSEGDQAARDNPDMERPELGSEEHHPWVLLVEDDPLVREVTLEMLEVCGARAVGAAHGAEALVRIQRSTFDLLLVDLNLPDMNGIKCLDLLLPTCPGARACIISGASLEPDQESWAQDRGVGYLCKPVPLSRLRELIASLL